MYEDISDTDGGVKFGDANEIEALTLRSDQNRIVKLPFTWCSNSISICLPRTKQK